MTDFGPTIGHILAIDTAILSGSVALFADRDLLYSVDSGVSRSEVLVSEVARILRETSITAQALDKIVVSVGPGSFTGIRIGIATALGLARSSSADCIGISVFDAVSSSPESEGALPVLPLGRNQFAVTRHSSQSNTDADPGDFEILDEKELLGRLEEGTDRYIHPRIGDPSDGAKLQIFLGRSNVTFCQETIAQMLVRANLSGQFVRNLSPIYAQR